MELSKKKEKSELFDFYEVKEFKTSFFPTKDCSKIYTNKKSQFKSWQFLKKIFPKSDAF